MASHEGSPTASKWILSATMCLEVVTVLALVRPEVLRDLRFSSVERVAISASLVNRPG
jgi:hypothetical protein